VNGMTAARKINVGRFIAPPKAPMRRESSGG
jgi:hypothetical protein